MRAIDLPKEAVWFDYLHECMSAAEEDQATNITLQLDECLKDVGPDAPLSSVFLVLDGQRIVQVYGTNYPFTGNTYRGLSMNELVELLYDGTTEQDRQAAERKAQKAAKVKQLSLFKGASK